VVLFAQLTFFYRDAVHKFFVRYIGTFSFHATQC